MGKMAQAAKFYRQAVTGCPRALNRKLLYNGVTIAVASVRGVTVVCSFIHAR
jgi:hypothetical protein